MGRLGVTLVSIAMASANGSSAATAAPAERSNAPSVLIPTDTSMKAHGSAGLLRSICREWPASCSKGRSRAVRRDEFVVAVPEANLDEGVRSVRRPQGKARVVPTVQAHLEETARESAVIFDCKPARSGRVSNCGLYLYDRDRRSVVASSVRYFSMPVNDPSPWAIPLVDTFEKGLHARSRLEDEKVLSEFYARNAPKDEPDEGTFVFGLEGGFTRAGGGDVARVPRLGLLLGREYGGHTFSIVGTYATATADASSTFRQFHALGVGIEFSLRAEALEILTWEFGLRGGWERATYETSGTRGGSQSALIGFRPGFLAAIGKRMKFGPSLGWAYRTPLSMSGPEPGKAAGHLLEGAAFEPALRLEVSF